MLIGERLRSLRESKNLSQGDIEERTGLIRCYVSRVENGHTVPSIETLEKFARALEMPLYAVVYDGSEPPKPKFLLNQKTDGLWGDARQVRKLVGYLAKMKEPDRKLLLAMAAHTAKRGDYRKTEKN